MIGMASVVQARFGFSRLAEQPQPTGVTATDAYGHWPKCIDIHDLLAGCHPGRSDSDAITLFKNNAVQGVADIAVAGVVLDKALEQGLGTPIAPA